MGTEMPTQHRLLVLVFHMKRKIVEKKIKVEQTIIWGRLKGDMVATLLSKSKTSGYPSISDDANQMWVTMAHSKGGKGDIRGVNRENQMCTKSHGRGTKK